MIQEISSVVMCTVNLNTASHNAHIRRKSGNLPDHLELLSLVCGFLEGPGSSYTFCLVFPVSLCSKLRSSSEDSASSLAATEGIEGPVLMIQTPWLLYVIHKDLPCKPYFRAQLKCNEDD